MEKSIYFSTTMAISQNYLSGNHLSHNTGTPKDYPIDECYGSSERTGFCYAPCQMKVVKKYGPAVGNNCTTNQIWLTSIEKVQMPLGEDYLTMMITHISNDDMNNIQIGHVYSQKSKICEEYKDANSTGYHNHVSFGLGALKNSGWAKNTNSVWVLTTENGTIKPEQAMYVDTDFTLIKNAGEITWIPLTTIIEFSEYKAKIIATENLNIRASYSSTSTINGKLSPNDVVLVNASCNGWLRLSDGRGWIYAKYTEKYVETVETSTQNETDTTATDTTSATETIVVEDPTTNDVTTAETNDTIEQTNTQTDIQDNEVKESVDTAISNTVDNAVTNKSGFIAGLVGIFGSVIYLLQKYWFILIIVLIIAIIIFFIIKKERKNK